jgi:putative ATP-binding cassette transporter
LCTLILVNVVFGIGFYNLPYILFNESLKALITDLEKSSGMVAIMLGYVLCILFSIYVFLSYIFLDKIKKPIIVTGITSIIGGLSSTGIIIILNKAIQDTTHLNLWFIYFCIAIFFSYLGGKLVGYTLLRITNDAVFETRVKMLNLLLKAAFDRFEKFDKEKIQSCLTNDTVAISSSSNIIVAAVSSSTTLLFCFIYMAILDVYVLISSVIVIIVAASIYYIYSKQASKLWEKNRDVMNTFFGFVQQLLYGFKELVVHHRKTDEFKDDMIESFEQTRQLGKKAEYKMTNVGLFGSLIFVLVLGVVVFVYPLMFKSLERSQLLTFVFLFLYISGPVNTLINIIPQLMRIKISLKRIKELTLELSVKDDSTFKGVTKMAFEKLNLVEVSYSYIIDSSNRSFVLGPLNMEFEPSQIYFIIGGNGSGKTTLAKLLTGLYSPSKGEIYINDKQVTNLGEYISVIYSDYFLFKKMYGIDHNEKEDIIQKMLFELELENKITIEEGRFENRNLSSGQRKRLALLLSYLEDAPIVLFDEWASDQDPKFRNYFYTHLLPDLKKKGKCVIIITHDDSYYHIADKILKLDVGTLLELKESQAV